MLDIGAWDGKFSFLAERAGASRVVALDHYAWGVDFGRPGCLLGGVHQTRHAPGPVARRDRLLAPGPPGPAGFEFAAAALGSRVEPVVADFQTVDLGELGQFDVVLYLGVLYHMKEPLTCLERVRAVTKEVAVIETEAVHLQGLDHEALLQFYAGSSLHTDFGNWYVPTIEALRNMCRAAGFSEVRTVVGPPPRRRPSRHPGLRLRLGRRIGHIPVPTALGAQHELPRRRPRLRLTGPAHPSLRASPSGSRLAARCLLGGRSEESATFGCTSDRIRATMSCTLREGGWRCPKSGTESESMPRSTRCTTPSPRGEGLSQWWTNDVEGDARVGGELAFFFGGPDRVAKMEVVESSRPSRVVWRGAPGGPDEWVDTTFTFELRAEGDETVVLFTNAGWREPVEFMHHCSTAWAYYLLSLKHGLEGGKATPFPRNELVSSWG